MGFLSRLFGSDNGKDSAQRAKNRLQIILINDRTDITPELLENLREEILNVIIKYVDIERSKIAIDFEKEQGATALVANIPILRIKRGGSIAMN